MLLRNAVNIMKSRRYEDEISPLYLRDVVKTIVPEIKLGMYGDVDAELRELDYQVKALRKLEPPFTLDLNFDVSYDVPLEVFDSIEEKADELQEADLKHYNENLQKAQQKAENHGLSPSVQYDDPDIVVLPD